MDLISILEKYKDEIELYIDTGFTNEDGDVLTIADYVENHVLDYRLTINSDMTYSGVCCIVALGGPNVYIDTVNSVISIDWWGKKASIPLNDKIEGEIDTFFWEVYESSK